jgi:Domain of unknown function (DUF1906)
MSPSFQGLDRAVAPAPATAKRMLDTINGRWWNVYIGGPESGGHGWSPEVVRQYAREGIDRFMLTYVGRQWRGPLTRAQGQADARDALEIARGYGYSGDFPLCLDVELPTFESSPSKTIAYVRAWCATVRQGGARPGVYANPGPLIAMAKAKVPASFVWVASWVSTTAGRRNPHDAKGMPANLWGDPGQRAWQYAGIINGRPCNVLGLSVDINVADLGCLAPPPPGARVGASQVKRVRVLRRGDRGAVVVRLTHRLSVLRSRRTGQPYLDGARMRFDVETEAGLKVFQKEHGLAVDGAYGRNSARALVKAVRRAKKQRQPAHQASSNGSNGTGGAGAATRGVAAGATNLPKLVHEFQRLDAAADRAWERLEDYGRKRRQLLAHAQANPRVSLADVTASLGRIEKQLATLVDLETREVALAERPADAPGAFAGAIGGRAYSGGPDGESATGEAYPRPEDEASAPAGVVANGSNGARSTPEQARRSIATLSNEELDALIDRLDERLDKARRIRIARYARVEKALGKLPRTPAVKPGRGRGAGPKPGPGPGRGASPKPGPRRGRGGGPKPEPRRGGAGGWKPAPKPRGPVGSRPKATPMHPAGRAGNGKPRLVASPNVRALQLALNRFTGRYLEGIAPLVVDGKKGRETNKRIRTVKYYLGYGGDERRSAAVKPAFVRRLRHPRSPRVSGPAMIARAERRRRKQRERAKLVVAGAIEGTPKQIIDAIVLPIAEACGIRRSPAENDAANARHGPTISGSISDHQGPPGRAWAADISNGGSPTPEMDKLARRLAQRFNIGWPGFGLHSATHSGYRFQLIYRTHQGGNHFNHVHFGVRDV